MSDRAATPDARDFTADLGHPLRVPPAVELGPLAGRGKRSITFRATWRGEHVALKVYRRKFIDKYRRRYALNIARYEYERNVAFHALETLRPYAARPFGVFDDEAASSLCFLQEFVNGISLKELAAREGGVPPETLDAGRRIVAAASAAGLYDLDISTRNIMVRNTEAGWMPVVYDFNLVPQYLYPPNPFVALAYWSGLRRKSHRDHRAIRNWARLSKT
jgi:hypothetical protein